MEDSEVRVRDRRSKVKVKAVFGVGTNDADYAVVTYDKDKKVEFICPYYTRWKHMLYRCYDPKYQSGKPTYIGCTVCDEWLTFSNFKAWMEKQDWEGKELDKDLIDPESFTYSPETCLFIPRDLNTALSKLVLNDNGLPTGVSYQDYQKGRCKYIVAYYNDEGKRTSKRLLTLEESFDFYTNVRFEQLSRILIQYGLQDYIGNLRRRFDIMKDKLKDRKGKMVHGMYIKQKDLDALSELGVEVVEKDGEVYFEGVGSKMSYNDFTAASEALEQLSLTFELTPDWNYLRTTGRV